ncbi:MAG: hypothetical protein M3R61_07745 [Chloroflexota bacterium]|nr:hypothetical protein [Chloroflexota bacterium]
MRFKVFVSLLVITLVLDVALLSFSLLRPEARVFELPVALAAEPPEAPALPQPTVTAIPAAPTALPATIPTPPKAPTATRTPPPIPTSSPTATAEVTATAVATVTPVAQLLGAKSVAFTPGDKAVRANIRLALEHYYGALTHIVLAPGGVFSFNSTLGVRPQRLPWKNVKLKPTAAPPAPPAPDGTSVPTPAAVAQTIQGGGLCDLASRFVMATRPLLPGSAFRFVNHVKSNGIQLSGVPTRDTVSIWAIGGGQGEHDLLISNPTNGWLEFTVDRDGEKITVTAQLWDSSPPGW